VFINKLLNLLHSKNAGGLQFKSNKRKSKRGGSDKMKLKHVIPNLKKSDDFQRSQLSIMRHSLQPIYRRVLDNDEFQGMTGLTICVCLLLFLRGIRGEAPPRFYINNYSHANHSFHQHAYTTANHTSTNLAHQPTYNGNVTTSQPAQLPQLTGREFKSSTSSKHRNTSNKDKENSTDQGQGFTSSEQLVNRIQSLLSKPGYDLLVIKTIFNQVMNVENPEEQQLLGAYFLNTAIIHGQKEVVKYFLEKGINPNVRGTENFPPLAIAAVYNQAEIAELLVNNGATASNIQNYDDLANDSSFGPNSEIVTTAGRSFNHLTRLDIAVLYDPKSIEAVVASGADVQAYDSNGMTPLHIAASKNPDAIKPLVSAGARINALSLYEKATALDVACVAKNLLGVINLLKEGADPNIPNKHYRTPIQRAAIDFEEAVHELIKGGANVNIEDKNGITPLMYAITNKHMKAVRLFLKNNANYDKKALLKFMENTPFVIKNEVLAIIKEIEDKKFYRSLATFKQSLKDFLSQLLLFLLLVLSLLAGVYIIQRIRYRRSAQQKLKSHKTETLAMLNQLTSDYYAYEWLSMDDHTFSLNATIKPDLCLDSKILSSELIKILNSITKEVKVSNNLVSIVLPPAKFPQSIQTYLTKLESASNQSSPKNKLESISNELAVLNTNIEQLVSDHQKQTRSVDTYKEKAEKTKIKLSTFQSVRGQSLNRKLQEALPLCDEIIRRSTIWLALPLPDLQKQYQDLVTQLTNLTHQIKNHELDYLQFEQEYNKLSASLKKLEHVYKDNLEGKQTHLREIKVKSTEVLATTSLLGKQPKNRKNNAQKTKPSKHNSVYDSSMVSAPEIIEPAEENERSETSVPIVIEHKIEKSQTEIFVDDRHIKQEPTMITAARPLAQITLAPVHYFSDRKKPKERPKGTVQLQSKATLQEALNLSAAIANLDKLKDLTDLERNIEIHALFYHVVRFLKGLWDISLHQKDNPELSIQISIIRHTLVHIASIKNLTSNYMNILFEGAQQIKLLLADPFIYLMKHHKDPQDKYLQEEIGGLINKFPLAEIVLLNPITERLTPNEIFDCILEALTSIGEIGKPFTYASDLSNDISRSAAIKMHILKIAQHCEYLENHYPTEFGTLSNLLPKILWQSENDDSPSVQPLANILKVMRTKICHYTKEKFDHSYADIPATYLLRLIHSLADSGITKSKILEHIEVRHKFISIIKQHQQNDSSRMKISDEIISACETNNLTLSVDCSRLIQDRINLKADMQQLKKWLQRKYHLQDGSSANLLRTAQEQGEEKEARNIQLLLEKKHQNYQQLLVICSQPESICHYVKALEKGLAFNIEFAEELLAEFNPSLPGVRQ
jgi:ankyrin repeat protein